ncbi:28S ribosomal protein S17, mitochondrial isoform X2 [Diaphorina citri]|uniref:28S ribosomal protein S17, mitochondrial isoform X2 n=1 Tax=Diaphorina citri TaxID=121845 RepID=A0A3Q0J2X0_DIACI|nr:28S ribosomal protein S17, mitochondrial isoform X2 [Diaphorina citri]
MRLSQALRASLLLGKCLPTVKSNCSRFSVKRYVYDDYLHTYFPKFTVMYAHDPDKICKTGDIVLIEELPQKLTTLITHKVNKVVYPLGDITDPITGKKVVGLRVDLGKVAYRDFYKELYELYGKNPQRKFDYKKAPRRGWQEDKKDFTHRESYIRYHEFDDDDQPYAVYK